MAQNIYDDKSFFSAYSQLPRQLHGLDGAPEWDSFRSLIPSVQGASVLDNGCGYGWLCRWASDNGAAKVTGIELSDNMLSKAREFPNASVITYLQADLETLEPLPQNTYDVAVSSLALHYLANLPQLVSNIYAALKPGASFVFSVEHPMYTSPWDPKFIEAADGHKIWQLDGYLSEGPRTTNWLADGVIKQHRMLGTYVSIFLSAGFVIAAIDEWGPSLEDIKKKGRSLENRERPMFVLMKVVKPE